MMASIDEATLASLMAEVDSPVLQHQVLRLADAAAAADRHLAEAEAQVMAAACRRWGIADRDAPRARQQALLQPA